MERNNDNRNGGIPENDPSKPMDSKREVEQSNDPKTDQDFPGYPHYPAREDIMDQRTGSKRTDIDVEQLAGGQNASGVNQRFLAGQDRQKAEDAMMPQPGSGNDDLDVTDSRDAEIGSPQNVSNEDMNTDLDIPGSELDDRNEEIGEEDEENNYYSLGGDQNE